MSKPLPLVELRGPDIRETIDPNVDAGATDNAFWVLVANAPQFQRKKEKEPQEGRIHTIRTLLADVDAVRHGDLQWRNPRLMSMQIIVGDQKRFAESEERFFVRLPRKSDPVDSTFADKLVFHTVGPEPNKAAFQQVVAEPVFDLDTWPDLDTKTIKAPPFRLVAGAIELRLTGDALEWLGPLGKNRSEVIVRLTPDGIELQAKVMFPGKGEIEGYFLLYPGASGTRLRLLSDRLQKNLQNDWRAAWDAVTPKQGDEETIAGLRVEPRRGGLVPQFEWDAKTTKKKLDEISATVDVPASDLRIRLLSPTGRDGVDGEVSLKPDLYHLTPTNGSDVVLTATMKSAVSQNPSTRFVIEATKDTVQVKLASTSGNPPAHICAHDEVALARALRTANGFDELLPDRADRARPLLSAFVPLDDGWLQLPVPNTPPPDVTKDDVSRVDKHAANVLSGYLRFAQAAEIPPVLSAFPAVNEQDPAPFTVDEAPWVLTIEAAESLDFRAAIKTGSPNGTLLRASASLNGPQITTRGFMWISSDRPDALEALPRLGAGAGAYFDVPLETFDIEKAPIVQVTISQLEVTVTRKKPFDSVSRDALALKIGFDAGDDWKKLSKDAVAALDAARKVLLDGDPTPDKATPKPVPPVVWRRHPAMPLAAGMPMTRGALSAVRPLESRDLVPFTIDVEDGGILEFAMLQWGSDAVFPDLMTYGGTAVPLRTVAAWPWPPKVDPPQPNGIAIVAFGVPGTELALLDDKSSSADPWSKLRFALRFDLPALDEAFATATLPPQPPKTAPPEEREAPPPVPTPLAHDWISMSRFWGEQNRVHQLARVSHSYLAPYRDVGNGTSKNTKIEDLIGGATWTTKTGFAPGAGQMPYGAADVGGTVASHDDALLGVSGTFSVSGANVTVDQGTVKNLVGYAPASFDEDGFLMDSRRTGTRKALLKGSNRLLWREIAIKQPRSDVNALATLVKPLTVSNLLLFWFKDLPLADGTFTPVAAGVDFNAWQDGHLPRSGFEWRLVPIDGTGVFERGRDRIPFFGFMLEPLRLDSLKLAFSVGEPTGTITGATIRARLYLGPNADGPASDGNLVTLTLKDDGAGQLKITGFDGTDLQFAFNARETDKTSPRRIAIKGRCEWKDDLPKFTLDALTVSMFGKDRGFEAAKATLAPDGVIHWKGDAATSPVPGHGAFVVEEITVTPTETSAELALKSRLVITPRHLLRGTVTPPRAAIEAVIAADAVDSLRIVRLGVSGSSAKFVEGEDALTLTAKAEDVKGEIVGVGENNGRGLPVQGRFTLGIAAKIEPPVNGSMELTAGWLDGELVAKKNATFDDRIKIHRLGLHAEQRPRTERAGDTIQIDWIGGISFHGSLLLDNAIGWPGIMNGGDIEPVTTGRSTVTLDHGTFYTHRVEYMLDGHQLPFDVAARIDSGMADIVWTTPAVATHTLKKKDTNDTVSFTGVETFALGTATAIIPILGDKDGGHPDRSYKDDPVTFAARHREKIVNGEETNKITDGMVLAGVGRIATVLSGALGVPFRAAFTTRKGLFLAGGFAGIVGAIDGKDAPLVRLPVLVAIDPNDDLAKPGIIQSQPPDNPAVEVAWADGRAVRNIIATLRGSVTPASVSERALRAALLAGSRAVSSAGLTEEQTMMAVLVEQSFAVDSDNPLTGDLKKTPFFIAATVTLARLLAKLDSGTAPIVLSLIAGRGLHRNADPPFTSGLASAVVTRNLPADSTVDDQERLRGCLVTIGNDFVVHDWTGPAVADLESIVPLALVAAPAFADHVDPRVVLIRSVSDGDSQYDAPSLPRHHERPRAAEAASDRAFADAGRGYALPPGADSLRWLAGPEEGGTTPFRDAGDGDSSGLAGLSRPMAMPAHALAVGDAVQPADLALVWVAQSRAPVYLPLSLDKMNAPPIPWLSPGTPRPRNPAGSAVSDALHKLDLTFTGQGVQNLQPILPEAATLASVSDRAGISLARIARFETAAGTIAAFDGRYARFGRPAQGGSWSAHTERTPRPGPLPLNRGDEERDRRPCISRVRPIEPLDVVAGPADRVTGEPNSGATFGAWSVTFVAAAEWSGMVTDRWDGTLNVRAEVELEGHANDTTPPVDVLKTLFRLLFPANGDVLLARANLVIGGMVVPFVRMHVKADSNQFAIETGDGRVIRHGVVTIVLDARADDASGNRGAAHAAIAAAFKAAELPPVEVQFVVQPDSNRPEPASVAAVNALTVDVKDATIAEGDGRAPVTLRIPLAPVVRAHGALPLAPASILFLDPAYDVALSSAPAEKRARVSNGAGPRGSLTVSLYADRSRINRRASITFMLDAAYEKKFEGRAQLLADGDFVSSIGTFDLELAVIPKASPRRKLFVARPSIVAIAGFVAPPQPKITLAKVYELPLSAIVESDGTAAALVAGDLLELRVVEPAAADDAHRVSVTVLKESTGAGVLVQPIDKELVERTLLLTLTDEPVVEPPPALYAALVRRATPAVRLSLPLYAQSPLPLRVDLRDARRDFRNGVMRRTATFIWLLARPKKEKNDTRIYVVKADRNGQTHLPADETELVSIRKV